MYPDTYIYLFRMLLLITPAAAMIRGFHRRASTPAKYLNKLALMRHSGGSLPQAAEASWFQSGVRRDPALEELGSSRYNSLDLHRRAARLRL